jgi:hypothetical protein
MATASTKTPETETPTAFHLEVLYCMYEKEFDLSDASELTAYYGRFGDVLSGEKIFSDKTFERFAGEEKSESKPEAKTLNQLIKYFRRNPDSPFNRFAKSVNGWKEFVVAVNRQFKGFIPKVNYPLQWNRGKNLAHEGHDKWLAEMRQNIRYGIIPELMEFKPQLLKKAPQVLEVQEPKSSQPLFAYKSDAFVYMTPEYWQALRKNTQQDELVDYYVRSDSNSGILPKIIAYQGQQGERYYIEPEKNLDVLDDSDEENASWQIKSISELLDLVAPSKSILIKILSGKGEGKSTFLMHIAKTLAEQFHIFYCISNKEIDNLSACLPQPLDSKPLLFFFDDSRHHKDALERYGKLMNVSYNERAWGIILAERESRYEKREEAESLFENRFTVSFRNSRANKEKFFDKLFTILSDEKLIPEGDYIELKNQFVSNEKLTLVECVRQLYRQLAVNKKLKIPEDWEDWENYIKKNPLYKNLFNLYMVVATFDMFGIGVPIQFSSEKYLPDCNPGLIIKALDRKNIFSSPIYIENGFLKLRHESMADWYFEEEDHREIASYFFDDFLDHIEDRFSAYLFRNLHGHPEFITTDFLSQLLLPDRSEKILRAYLNIAIDNDERGKTTIELCKVMLNNKAANKDRFTVKNEVIAILERRLQENGDDKHAGTFLGGLYTNQGRFAEAEKRLNKVLELDPNNSFALIRLIGTYKKWNKQGAIADLYRRLWENQYFDLNTLLSAAKRLYKERKYIDALEILEVYNKNNETRYSAIYTSQILWKLGHRQKSIAILEKYSSSIKIQFELAKLYLECKGQENTKIALKYLYSGSEQNHAGSQILLSSVLKKLGEKKEVILPIIEQGLQNPGCFNKDKLLIAGSRLYREENDTESAIAFIDKYLDFLPASINLTEELVNCLMEEEEYERVDKILNAIPDKNKIWFRSLHSKFLEGTNQLERSMDVLRGIYSEKPTDSSALGHLIRLATKLNDSAEIKKYTYELIKLEPQSENAIKHYSSLVFSHAPMDETDLDMARTILSRNPYNHNLRLIHATILKKLGHEQMFLAEINKLEDQFRGNKHELFFQLAELHYETNFFHEAKFYYEQIPDSQLTSHHTLLGVKIYSALKDDRGIIATFEKRLKTNSLDLDIHLDYLHYFIDRQAYDYAQQVLTTAFRIFKTTQNKYHIRRLHQESARLYYLWTKLRLKQSRHEGKWNEQAIIDGLYFLTLALTNSKGNKSFLKLFKQAIDQYNNLLNEINTNLKYPIRTADRKRLIKLKESIRKTIDTEPSKLKIWNPLKIYVRLAYLLGDRDAFVKCINEVIQKYPGKKNKKTYQYWADINYKAGTLYFNRDKTFTDRDNVMAKKFFKDAIRFDKTNFRAKLRLVRFAIAEKNRDLALTFLSELSLVYPASGCIKVFRKKLKKASYNKSKKSQKN